MNKFSRGYHCILGAGIVSGDTNIRLTLVAGATGATPIINIDEVCQLGMFFPMFTDSMIGIDSPDFLRSTKILECGDSVEYCGLEPV